MDDLEGIRHGDGGHTVSTEVAERVRAVLSAAEAAASALRHEAEQEAQARRRASDEESRRQLEDARRDAEAYLKERLRRIAELSDTILERSEEIVARLDRADDVRRQLQGLVDALGQTAEELATDARSHRAPGDEPEPGQEPAPVAALRAPEPAPVASAPEPAPEPPSEPEPVLEAEPEDAELDTAEHEPEPAGSPGRGDGDDEDLAARLVALQMAVAGANRGEAEEHLQAHFALDDLAPILDDVFGRGTEADKRVTWPEAVRDTGS